MNYTSLKANVEEICEQTFTADQHALFAQQAEQKIFNLAIVDNDTQTFLLNKDSNFLREAYPVTTTAKRGLPKFYAYHSTSGSNVKFMFSPIPDANYTLEHIYAMFVFNEV